MDPAWVTDIRDQCRRAGVAWSACASLDLTQRELAERLGVYESQVSRDEWNEYHDVTVDRASRILDALGARMRSAFEQPRQA